MWHLQVPKIYCKAKKTHFHAHDYCTEWSILSWLIIFHILLCESTKEFYFQQKIKLKWKNIQDNFQMFLLLFLWFFFILCIWNTLIDKHLHLFISKTHMIKCPCMYTHINIINLLMCTYSSKKTISSHCHGNFFGAGWRILHCSLKRLHKELETVIMDKINLLYMLRCVPVISYVLYNRIYYLFHVINDTNVCWLIKTC